MLQVLWCPFPPMSMSLLQATPPFTIGSLNQLFVSALFNSFLKSSPLSTNVCLLIYTILLFISLWHFVSSAITLPKYLNSLIIPFTLIFICLVFFLLSRTSSLFSLYLFSFHIHLWFSQVFLFMIGVSSLFCFIYHCLIRKMYDVHCFPINFNTIFYLFQCLVLSLLYVAVTQ